MRSLLRSSILATLFASTSSLAFAAEFTPPSKIGAVTVFPQGANVVREIEVDLPAGEHSIVLKDLPQTIDPQSVRVTGDATGNLVISSVDTSNTFQPVDVSAKSKVLEKEILELSFERAALDQTMADFNQQRTLLMSLADKQLVPQSTTETVKAIDTASLGNLLDLVGVKLSDLSKNILDAQKRQRDIDEQINVLNIQISELSPQENYRTEVVVNVAAKEPLKTVLKVSYRVPEASWQPFYDARLKIGDGKSKPSLELINRAEVTQNTGETWDNITLLLSTARPGGATAAPDLTPFEVGQIQPEPLSAAPVEAAEGDREFSFGVSARVGDTDSKQKLLLKPQRVAQQQSAILNIGFQATYQIASRVSIDNSGQSKKVRMKSSEMEASLEAISVPRLDPAAYLTASFKTPGQGPQLPGVVNLFRDGVYVGQGSLPLLNPGEDTKLGFGADDLVKVTRNEVKRLSSEEGIISTSNVDERSWDITVKNLHDFALPVRVLDRVPFSTNEDIVVKEMAGMTEPTKRNLDKQRGVMAWDFVAEAKGETTLKTGYKITWPQGQQVSIVD